MEAYDADELVSYRSLSSLAILALVLGLFSPLSLIAPPLFVIPLAGMAVALLAIRNILAQPGILTGMTLAKIALFLCTFCLVVAPVKSAVSASIYKKQADQAAQRWFETIVEGDLSEALGQLTPSAIGGLSRPDPASGNPADRQPSQPAIEDVVEALGKDHFVEDLRAQAESGPLDFTAVSMSVDTNRSQPAVSIDYSIDNKGGSSSVMIQCLRVNTPPSGKSWKIEAWKQAADHTHSH